MRKKRLPICLEKSNVGINNNGLEMKTPFTPCAPFGVDGVFFVYFIEK